MRSLGPAEHFAAGAIGEPGSRTFYFHITAGGEPLWLAAEKQQVAAFAEHAIQLLAASEIVASPEAVEGILARLEITDPLEPVFRVGAMAMNTDPDGQLVTVVIESADPETDDGIEFAITPEQLQAMALKSLEAVGQGRPLCALCRLPKDPEGHRCPSTNGHHAD